jgi:hypothetical protein
LVREFWCSVYFVVTHLPSKEAGEKSQPHLHVFTLSYAILVGRRRLIAAEPGLTHALEV